LSQFFGADYNVLLQVLKKNQEGNTSVNKLFS
jgi:hypothetical protein